MSTHAISDISQRFPELGKRKFKDGGRMGKPAVHRASRLIAMWSAANSAEATGNLWRGILPVAFNAAGSMVPDPSIVMPIPLAEEEVGICVVYMIARRLGGGGGGLVWKAGVTPIDDSHVARCKLTTPLPGSGDGEDSSTRCVEV